MRELSEVIFRPKFDPYIAQEARLRILKGLAKEARWFAPSKEIIRCRDAADNRFLELAIAAQAEFLITGDQDLLILGQIQSTRICTLTEFADLRLTTL